ncbi:hypothetical protein GCM10027268_06550 [Brachybacterium huguangmaarense]
MPPLPPGSCVVTGTPAIELDEAVEARRSTVSGVTVDSRGSSTGVVDAADVAGSFGAWVDGSSVSAGVVERLGSGASVVSVSVGASVGVDECEGDAVVGGGVVGVLGGSLGLVGSPEGLVGSPEGLVGSSEVVGIGVVGGGVVGVLGGSLGLVGSPEGLVGSPEGLVGSSEVVGIGVAGSSGVQGIVVGIGVAGSSGVQGIDVGLGDGDGLRSSPRSPLLPWL